MKIALFHYHLKPGGVTDVVVFSVRSLLKKMDSITEIRLVTGDETGCERVMERVRDGLDRRIGDKLKLDILDELGYVEDGASPDVDRLTERLLARYDEDTLWWIHNYHLGKNPSFTAALMKVADAGSRDLLLHIHDFPECGRPDNLRRLDEVLELPAYPAGPRIRYAVINERDRKILADAGLGEAVHLLSNPVPPPPQGDINPAVLRKALEESCGKQNPGFIPDAPVLLYPIRCIRRKNVFEAALMTILLEAPMNLVVTLPGVSAQEKGYSDLAESAFKDGLIPGVWCPEASGDDRLGYGNLAAGCDAVISTSVQEGFGYLFLNALHWRKPLLARYLDILDGILDLFGEYPRRFWADFRVPADEALVEKTKNAYLSKFEGAEEFFPEKTMKSIRSSAEKIAAGGGIDISYLAVDDQWKLLKKAKSDREWLESARNLNRELLDSISRTLLAKSPDMSDILGSRFSESAYARTFSEILSGFGAKTPSSSPAKIRESVMKAFGRIDYLRLLYDF